MLTWTNVIFSVISFYVFVPFPPLLISTKRYMFYTYLVCAWIFLFYFLFFRLLLNWKIWNFRVFFFSPSLVYSLHSALVYKVHYRLYVYVSRSTVLIFEIVLVHPPFSSITSNIYTESRTSIRTANHIFPPSLQSFQCVYMMWFNLIQFNLTLLQETLLLWSHFFFA